ncbi:MAG: hypothetical protein ACMUEM_00090 [Flavobacteriales bacterium AspAUS03]
MYNILEIPANQGQNTWEALSVIPDVAENNAKFSISIIGKNTVTIYIKD